MFTKFICTKNDIFTKTYVLSYTPIIYIIYATCMNNPKLGIFLQPYYSVGDDINNDDNGSGEEEVNPTSMKL